MAHATRSDQNQFHRTTSTHETEAMIISIILNLACNKKCLSAQLVQWCLTMSGLLLYFLSHSLFYNGGNSFLCLIASIWMIMLSFSLKIALALNIFDNTCNINQYDNGGRKISEVKQKKAEFCGPNLFGWAIVLVFPSYITLFPDHSF